MAARLPKWIVKVLVTLAVMAGVVFLFIRSLDRARSTPYTVEREFLGNWMVRVVEGPAGTSPVLVLAPPSGIVPGLFGQVFARAGESLNSGAGRGIPLVLRAELERAFAGSAALESLAAAARSAGLESARLEPRCIAHFHVSEPGVTRQVYAAVFDLPAFDQFRRQIALQADPGAGDGSFDPAALSPVLLVGATDPLFDRWLPLRIDPASDCIAPLVAD
jgi:hypothetical protein